MLNSPLFLYCSSKKTKKLYCILWRCKLFFQLNLYCFLCFTFISYFFFLLFYHCTISSTCLSDPSFLNPHIIFISYFSQLFQSFAFAQLLSFLFICFIIMISFFVCVCVFFFLFQVFLLDYEMKLSFDFNVIFLYLCVQL